MSKEKKIFLPDAEQAGRMLEGAWQEFCKQAKEAGYDISDDTANGWLKDCFAAGYSYGSNDMLNTIRDQAYAEYMANGMMN